jgi:hypothetical protein
MAIGSQVSAGTHFECFDPNFNAATQNFYVDGNDVYWSSGQSFDPLESFANPSTHHDYLGNGVFKHRRMKTIIRCKATNKKFSKPKPASAEVAIEMCKNAIATDYDSPNPKMPKKSKYKLLTSGEFKISKFDKRYANVVIEAERKGWFLNGLHLVVCNINLLSKTAYVNGFYDAKYGDIPSELWDWYSIKRKDLIKSRY